MSSSQQKPDLEDSINVTEAHGRVVSDAAAAAREKRITDNGVEPITLWVLAACGLVLVVAGGILGAGGSLFSYDLSFRDGYERKPAPGAADTGPKPKEALAAYMSKGEKMYATLCKSCHQSDAKGDGAAYPSLVGSEWVIGETDRLAMIIINGLQGPISTGKDYGVMPARGIGLPAEDLAGVMTYVRNNFGNNTGDIVSVEMAQAALDISNAREKAGQAVTAQELNANHIKALPGKSIEASTLVNPRSLEPIAEDGANADS